MQRVETHTLLDSIAPKAAAAKGLVQGDVGGTTKRFNQLLDAVQAAATKGSSPANPTTAGQTPKLVSGDPQNAVPEGEAAATPTATDVQIGAVAANAVTTLIANPQSAAAPPVQTGETPLPTFQTLGNTATISIATPSDAAAKNNVATAALLDPATPAASQAQGGVSATPVATVQSTSVPQPSAAANGATVAPAPQGTVAPSIPYNPATQAVSAPMQATATNTPINALPAPVSAAHTSAPTPKPELPVVPAPAQQATQFATVNGEKLQSATLSPQALVPTAQASVTLGGAAPVATFQPEGQNRAPTALSSAPSVPTQITAAPQPIDPTSTAVRATQPAPEQQTILPGALNAGPEAEPVSRSAPTSIWQATKDAQPTFLTKPTTVVSAPAPDAAPVSELPEILSRTPAEALQSVASAGKDLTTLTPAQAAAHKAPVSKPFSEALMMQVKAAEVVDGRTSVHLHPRGLGNIDVEIIAGDADLASKVIVRVENPMILHHLREDRQLLAQTIGVSDNTVFEFHERGAEHQGGQSSGGQSGTPDTSLDGPDSAAPLHHADIVADDRIDILT